jgi:hypothetical protein
MMNDKGNKMEFREIETLVKRMVNASREKYGSYAHATGMLESQLITLLTVGDKESMIRVISRLADDLEKQNAIG